MIEMHAVLRVRWIGALLLTGACGCASFGPAAGEGRRAPAAGVRSDWGPFYSHYEDAAGAVRRRSAGPFWESRAAETNRLDALRPLYARSRTGDGWRHTDLLWPVGSVSTLGPDVQSRFLLAYYHDYDRTDPDGAWRFMLLPVYYQGRSKAGHPYFAIFPLGGRVEDFLFKDRIDFALFPLWVHSEIAGIETDSWLFPIYARTDDPRQKRLRIFPFYGQVRMRNHYKKTFVLWPLWSEAEWYYRQSFGSGYLLFPLYGRIRLSDQESWMVLPPFFRYSTGQRGESGYFPWPLVQWERGQRNKLYLWPLYGRRDQSGLSYRFILWPVYHHSRVERPDHVLRTHKVLPFVYTESKTRPYPPGGTDPRIARRVEIWPLCSWERDATARRLRFPDLWPGRDPPPVERSWAPCWTLFEHDINGDGADTELLWGLVRRLRRDGGAAAHVSLFPLFERTRDERDGRMHRSWSVLKGLVAREEEDGAARIRLLYFIEF
jgi:hypothetical protein